jgi:hypothetical protein
MVRCVSEIVRERQLAIRRELDRRGIALKVVAFDSGIPYDTLLSYFPGGERQAAEMPAGALRRLCGAIPADLLNLLLPDGWALVRIPSGVDYDEISEVCRDFVTAKDRAHHPESEAGRDIGPTEASDLGVKVVQLRGRVA